MTGQSDPRTTVCGILSNEIGSVGLPTDYRVWAVNYVVFTALAFGMVHGDFVSVHPLTAMFTGAYASTCGALSGITWWADQ